MVIKVYISRVSGNLEIRRKQDFVLSVLQGKKIPFEAIDISDAALADEKKFIKEHCKPSGNSDLLPPQIFNNSTHCGNYEEFFEANENNELKEFLKISTN